MTSDDKTQNEPIMDGATEATEQEKQDGREEQAAADTNRHAGLEDSMRSIRGVGESRTGADADDEPGEGAAH